MKNAPESQKLLSYLGFATKAGKAVSGSGAVESALKAGKAKVVLVSSFAGENTLKHFSDMASFREVPFFVVEGDNLGNAVGKPERKTVCITDNGFSEAVLKEINLNIGG